jgi:acetyl-CoA C-acetyltransferase
MDENKIPILVACGQVIDRSVDGSGATPVELMAAACREAETDSGSKRLLGSVDTIAACGLTVDADQARTPFAGAFSNVPKTVAKLLNVDAKQHYYAAMGGNTPQMLVNHFTQEIVDGNAETVLLTGGEALKTMTKRFDHWSKLLWPRGAWKDKPRGKPTPIGDKRASNSAHEMRYGLDMPASTYPLFENALCAHYNRSPADHMLAVGCMFEQLSKVAAQNPYAWFREARSAEQLITPTPDNRMIAYPYTKHLNSVILVNQAAALVLTTIAKAKALGIEQDKWVYLHGCADAHDHWLISDRINYHSSPALALVGRQALAMADKTIDEINSFDLYSCFPLHMTTQGDYL